MPTWLLSILCVIRKATSWAIWKLAKRFFLKPPAFPGSWDRVKKLPLTEFNMIMGEKKYKLDPLGGVLDYTLYDLDYYFYYDFSNAPLYGGDCDDASYAWFEYLKTKDMITSVYQVLCIDGWKIKSMHFFTVAKFNDGYYRLFNYRLYTRPFQSLEEACDVFKKEELTVSGPYQKMKWVVYQHLDKK